MTAKLHPSDLPTVLRMLETMTFRQVAAAFGFCQMSGDGTSTLRDYLKRHGHNPRLFAKAPKYNPQNLTPTHDNSDRPKLIREYPLGKHLVKVYEARYAML